MRAWPLFRKVMPGKYGRYDNDYVWIFTIEDGKILSVEEYNSDLLVATRVYGQKVTPPEE